MPSQLSSVGRRFAREGAVESSARISTRPELNARRARSAGRAPCVRIARREAIEPWTIAPLGHPARRSNSDCLGYSRRTKATPRR